MTGPVLTQANRFAGGTLGASAVVFLAAEAVTAAAWRDPSYSYLTNWISDLGVPDPGVFQGRTIDSPLAWVMNTGFILSGLLFLAGALTLARRLTGKARPATQILAGVATAGYLLLGLFHTSAAATADGTIALHFTGAFAAILAGNILALVLGTHWRRDPGTLRLGQALIILGSVGLAAVIVLGFTAAIPSAPNGLVERAAVYPILLSQLFIATSLLTARRPRTA